MKNLLPFPNGITVWLMWVGLDLDLGWPVIGGVMKNDDKHECAVEDRRVSVTDRLECCFLIFGLIFFVLYWTSQGFCLCFCFCSGSARYFLRRSFYSLIIDFRDLWRRTWDFSGSSPLRRELRLDSTITKSWI